MAGLAPNTAAYTWSRTSPLIRDRKVMALNTALERSRPLTDRLRGQSGG